MVLTRFSKQSRGLALGHRLIEKACFEHFALQHLNVKGTLYELAIPYLSLDLLDEVIATLLMTCTARVYPHVLTGSSAPKVRSPQRGL
jgi:hypothetical protein